MRRPQHGSEKVSAQACLSAKLGLSFRLRFQRAFVSRVLGLAPVRIDDREIRDRFPSASLLYRTLSSQLCMLGDSW